MNRLYTNLIAGAVIAAAAAISSTADAAVAGTIVDGQTITLNLTAFSQPTYALKPATDCTLELVTDYTEKRIAGLVGQTCIFSNSNVSDENYGVPCSEYRYVGGTYYYYFELNGGQEYYFHYNPGLYVGGDRSLDITFNFLESRGLRIGNLFPEPGASVYYNVADYPELQMFFSVNKPFTCDAEKTVMEYVTVDGTTATLPLDYAVTEYFVEWKVLKALREAANARPAIADGTVFTLKIASPRVGGEPLQGNYITSDGDIELQYRYRQLTSSVSVDYPDPMLSYWPENAEGGILKITFNGDLLPLDRYSQAAGRPAPVVNVFAGPYQDGGDEWGVGWPSLGGAPLQIDGNTLTVDFRGVRRPADTTGAAYTVLKSTPIVTYSISNILDINGNRIDFGLGSFSSTEVRIYDVPFVLLEKINPTYEYTPSSTSTRDVTLENVNSVELYVFPETADVIAIEGFEFLLEGRDTPLATVDVADTHPYEEDGMVYNIPVPRIAQTTGGTIILSAVCTSDDGYEYSMTARYVNEGIDEPDVEAPAPMFVTPFGGTADFLYNMVGVTWGFYTLTDNMGGEPMEGVITLPDGTQKIVKAVIHDTNGDEIGVPDVADRPTTNNYLMFRNFMDTNSDGMLIQTPGEWTLYIPAATVLINVDGVMVPNPEATMVFYITDNGQSSGIEGVDAEEDAVYYDLLGRRVTRPSSGLYIRNGKKILL